MSLKKIVYLHGLESQQGGQKVDYLSDKGYVFAPEMPYKQNPDLFQDTLEEIKELGNQLNEKLCPKGEAYRKRRMAAGEKSSAYLSGRAVKVCKGQMSGKKKKKKK